MYEESRLLDGTVVSQAHEYNHNSALPQVLLNLGMYILASWQHNLGK